MKWLAVVSALLLSWILVTGSPVAEVHPNIDHHYGAPAPILPMSFAHADHTTVGCIDCHHNYIDDTGGDPCMICHVKNADVWPLLEEQFHDLCRNCHVELSAQGEKTGPVRQCLACHVEDPHP